MTDAKLVKTIDKISFGRTGHLSSRIIFGAAALGAMRQEKADDTIRLVREYGVNHFDVAASYGDAELRLAPFLSEYRDEIFLATKTGDRTRDGAFKSIEQSLERMQIDQLDLIQFHNLTRDSDWETVMSEGGALKAAMQAQEQGLVKYVGVTGHGTRTAEMHLRSLAHFEFASVLLPYSHMSLQDERYKIEFEELYNLCQEKNVAMQTIKSIARRRWRAEDESKKFSWYEPIKEEAAIHRAVHWVLSQPGVFLNSSSDAGLLKIILEAAGNFNGNMDAAEIAKLQLDVAQDVIDQSLEPLFVRGEMDDVR